MSSRGRRGGWAHVDRARASSTALLAAIVVGVAGPVASRSSADDSHLGGGTTVDAETHLQLYEVRMPGAPAMLARRRLVQTLGLSHAEALGEERQRPDRMTWLRASLRLRLDQEFGDTCLVDAELCVRATAEGNRFEFQPLARDTRLEALMGYVELDSLTGRLRARAGRQLYVDVSGFARFDGTSLRFEPFDELAIEAFGGALVRDTSLAGSDAFVPEGVVRRDLDDLAFDRYPWVSKPKTTWAAGGRVEVGPRRWIRVRVGVRAYVESGDVADARLSIGASSTPLDELRLSADGVFDPSDGTLSDAMVGAACSLGEARLEARVERHLPRFDPGTIWGYFDLVPIDEASLSTTFRASELTSLGASVMARRADFGNTSEEDLGFSAHAQTRLIGFDLDLSAFVWDGDLSPLTGVALGVVRRVTSALELDLRASVWHFDDPMRRELDGTSIAETIGGAYTLTEQAQLRLEMEHAHSGPIGHRFRSLLSLVLEVWR